MTAVRVLTRSEPPTWSWWRAADHTTEVRTGGSAGLAVLGEVPPCGEALEDVAESGRLRQKPNWT